jgi:hypothetical protein
MMHAIVVLSGRSRCLLTFRWRAPLIFPRLLSFLTLRKRFPPAFAPDFRHMSAIAAYRFAAFTTCHAGFIGGKPVRGPFFVRRLAAFACDLFLPGGIHGGKTALTLTLALLCHRQFLSDQAYARSDIDRLTATSSLSAACR